MTKILRVKEAPTGGWLIETVTGIEFSGVLYATKESAEEFAAKYAEKPWIKALVPE